MLHIILRDHDEPLIPAPSALGLPLITDGPDQNFLRIGDQDEPPSAFFGIQGVLDRVVIDLAYVDLWNSKMNHGDPDSAFFRFPESAFKRFQFFLPER